MQIEEEEIMKTKLAAIVVTAVLSAAAMVYGQDTGSTSKSPGTEVEEAAAKTTAQDTKNLAKTTGHATKTAAKETAKDTRAGAKDTAKGTKSTTKGTEGAAKTTGKR